MFPWANRLWIVCRHWLTTYITAFIFEHCTQVFCLIKECILQKQCTWDGKITVWARHGFYRRRLPCFRSRRGQRIWGCRREWNWWCSWNLNENRSSLWRSLNIPTTQTYTQGHTIVLSVDRNPWKILWEHLHLTIMCNKFHCNVSKTVTAASSTTNFIAQKNKLINCSVTHIYPVLTLSAEYRKSSR